MPPAPRGRKSLPLDPAYWAVRLESAIAPDLDVSLVGPYHPVTFSFDGYRRGVRPADLAGWDSPIMDPGKPTRGAGGGR